MANTFDDEHTAAHVAELFRAFSDTSRVRILSLIIDSEKNVNTIAKILDLSGSSISHHLRGLRQMRLVVSKRDGKEVFYKVEDPHIRELFLQGVRHIREK